MSFIRVTDGNGSEVNMFYLYNQINSMVTRLGGKVEINCGDKINVLAINIDKSYIGYIRAQIEEKIADIISVNYKYKFFKEKILVKGLTPFQRELLLDALICADYEEDKRYVAIKMSRCREYSINGTFNFRMTPLKNKWKEIVTFIPQFFTESELRDFIIYIVREKKNKKVYIENKSVYDNNFNKLQRVLLTDEDMIEGKIIREVILSCCGEVELNDKISQTDEKYLKEYFGDRIIFGKEFYKSIDKRNN
jgi:hypothetical protein